MQESTVPRTGTDPITGIAISPPTSPNGHEPDQRPRVEPPPRPRATSSTPASSPSPRRVDCSSRARSATATCRRSDGQPALRSQPERQQEAHAPDARQGLPGRQEPRDRQGHAEPGHRRVDLPGAAHRQPTAPDYGYRPAVNAIIDRLKQALTGGVPAAHAHPGRDRPGALPDPRGEQHRQRHLQLRSQQGAGRRLDGAPARRGRGQGRPARPDGPVELLLRDHRRRARRPRPRPTSRPARTTRPTRPSRAGTR